MARRAGPLEQSVFQRGVEDASAATEATEASATAAAAAAAAATAAAAAAARRHIVDVGMVSDDCGD